MYRVNVCGVYLDHDWVIRGCDLNKKTSLIVICMVVK